jgi:hypothetical protein
LSAHLFDKTEVGMMRDVIQVNYPTIIAESSKYLLNAKPTCSQLFYQGCVSPVA